MFSFIISLKYIALCYQVDRNRDGMNVFLSDNFSMLLGDALRLPKWNVEMFFEVSRVFSRTTAKGNCSFFLTSTSKRTSPCLWCGRGKQKSRTHVWPMTQDGHCCLLWGSINCKLAALH